MVAGHEIEELQLELESKVCGLGVDALAELAGHLQVAMETKELGRLALSKKFREKIEQDLSEANDKLGRKEKFPGESWSIFFANIRNDSPNFYGSLK